MSPIDDDTIQCLQRLPRRAGECWQGAFVQLPPALTVAAESPQQPYFFVWISKQSHSIRLSSLLPPGRVDLPTAILTLVQSRADQGTPEFLPARLEVDDQSLASYLRQTLQDLNITVVLVERAEEIEILVEAMAEDFANPRLMMNPLDGPGVDVERIRAFSDAAALFSRSDVQLHLTQEELISIDSLIPVTELSSFMVSGRLQTGPALTFFSDEEDWREMHDLRDLRCYLERDRDRTTWMVGFTQYAETAMPVIDLWEEHELPLASDDQYPFVLSVRAEGIAPPDAGILTFIEGVLRVLAATSEDDLDAGSWTKRVRIHDGEISLALRTQGIIDEEEVLGTGEVARDRGGWQMPPYHRLIERIMWDLHRLAAGRGAGVRKTTRRACKNRKKRNPRKKSKR